MSDEPKRTWSRARGAKDPNAKGRDPAKARAAEERRNIKRRKPAREPVTPGERWGEALANEHERASTSKSLEVVRADPPPSEHFMPGYPQDQTPGLAGELSAPPSEKKDDNELLTTSLADPMWRLCSGELYQIAPSDGSGLQKFIPRPEQIAIFRAVHIENSKKILIPKARRLGMSTALGILLVDWCLFHKQRQCSLIDQNAADASRKLDTIMRVALENLPEWLRVHVKTPKTNDSQVSICVADTPPSTIYAGMNARGGSNDILWISEWGVIQYEDPKRSSKIRSGALPSARHGITIVETTWAGGKTGDLWELLEPALSGVADDWRVLFSPWWVDPRNVSVDGSMDAAALAYFEKIEPRLQGEGIALSDGQKRWWAVERRAQGIFMLRENPTFLDECWSSPVPGAIYAEEMDRARAEQRTGLMPVDPNSLVHTVWDLGAPLQTVVWYFQIVGRYIRFIDCDREMNETLIPRIAFMKAKGYSFGSHYFPHDAQQTERTGRTMASEFAAAWLKQGLEETTRADEGRANMKFVPRPHDIWVGINHAIQMFPLFEFREPACSEAMIMLSCYRARPERDGVLSRSEPVHDRASHTADPIRVLAEAHLSGMIEFKSGSTIVPEWGYIKESRKTQRRGMKPIRIGG